MPQFTRLGRIGLGKRLVALLGVCRAAILVGRGVVRVQTDGFVEIGDRGIDQPLGLKGISAAVVGPAETCLEANGGVEVGDGPVDSPWVLKAKARLL